MANVLLIGLGITALTALESLLSKCNVQAVVRRIDGDFYDPVWNLTQHLGIPFFEETSQKEIRSLILKFRPDCVVVSSYNQILTQELLELSTFINVHYSPLPRYRGRANVNWALINDEPYAAITIHEISPDLDEGNILYQNLTPIRFDDTIASLYDRLNTIQHDYLGEVAVRFLQGYRGVPQNHVEATYCCTRLPEDGEIQWATSTRSIDCLIRSLVPPFPGSYTYFEGKKLLVWHAEPVCNPSSFIGRIPGRVIGRSKAEGTVDVLTGDGILRVFEVQFEGDGRTKAANVIKSVKSTLGLRMTDLMNRIQALEQEVLRLKEHAE